MYSHCVRASVVLLGLALTGCVGEPAADPAPTENVAQPAALTSTCVEAQLCCEQAVLPSNPTIQLLLGLLGIVAPIDQLVGVNCVVDTGQTCNQTSLCCSTAVIGGLAVGCTRS